jgi:hypothetical protein
MHIKVLLVKLITLYFDTVYIQIVFIVRIITIFFVLSICPTSKNYMYASLVKEEANNVLLIIQLTEMLCKHHIQCIQWTILKALLATTVRTPYNIPF